MPLDLACSILMGLEQFPPSLEMRLMSSIGSATVFTPYSDLRPAPGRRLQDEYVAQSR
jgi:hypothetical protein